MTMASAKCAWPPPELQFTSAHPKTLRHHALQLMLSSFSCTGTGPPHFVPTAQGTFVHPAQAALSNFANPFRDTAAEPDPAHPTAPKPPRYSPVTPSIPPTSPLVPRSSQQLLSAPSSFSNPEAVHHSGAVHQKGAPTMGERKSGPVNLIEKRESFRTRRREREAALRSAECSASLLAGAKSSMDSEVSRLHSSASLAPTKEAPDMGTSTGPQAAWMLWCDAGCVPMQGGEAMQPCFGCLAMQGVCIMQLWSECSTTQAV